MSDCLDTCFNFGRWNVCLLAGAVLISLGGLGVFPGVALASLFADVDGLSAAYIQLLQASQWIFASALCVAGLAIRAWPAHAGGPGKWRNAFSGSALDSGIPLAGGLAAGLVQAMVFGNIPHITDATSHWFQSQVLAAGRWAAAAPPCPAAFFQHNVIIGLNGLWHTKYFPGHALWLFWPLRLAALPLAFALFLWVARHIVAHYFDRPIARAATGLMAVSPLLLLVAGSFMSHITVMMWMALCWAGLLAATTPRRWPGGLGWGAVGGFCGGMGFLTRPQDAALYAAFMLAVLLPRFWQTRRASWSWAAGVLLGLLPPLAFLGLWNHVLYGGIWASGYRFADSTALSHTPIIRDTIGFANGFTLPQAVRQSFWVALRLNQALLGWPAAVPLVLLALLLPGLRKKGLLLLAGFGWLYLPYFFFHYYGFELEARYCSAGAPFLILLVAAGLVDLFRRFRAAGPWRRNLAAGLAACFIYTVVYYWPLYLWPRYSQSYEEASPAIHRAAQAANLNLPALVLLPDKGFMYSSGFLYNDPALATPVLYARDLAAEIPCLRAAFPERSLYRFVPDTADRFQGRFQPVPAEGAVP